MELRRALAAPGGRGFFFLAFCWSLLILIPLVSATDHIVGANHGWQIPANAGPQVNLNYTVWAASQAFYVGDEVSFHYPENMYTVFQVNYSVYTNCTISPYFGHNWIYNWTSKSGRTVVPLNETKVYYFVDGTNCQNGMKVAVNVTKNTTEEATSVSKGVRKSADSSAPKSALTFSTLVLAQVVLFLAVWLLCPGL